MFLSELTVVLATVLFCSSGLLQVASAAAFLKRSSDAPGSNSKDATVNDDSLPLLQESAYLPPQLVAYDMNSPQVVYRRELEDLADEQQPLQKRAQTFVRFGKRAQTFVRFGKRAQTFVRFG